MKTMKRWEILDITRLTLLFPNHYHIIFYWVLSYQCNAHARWYPTDIKHKKHKALGRRSPTKQTDNVNTHTHTHKHFNIVTWLGKGKKRAKESPAVQKRGRESMSLSSSLFDSSLPSLVNKCRIIWPLPMTYVCTYVCMCGLCACECVCVHAQGGIPP